VESGPETPCLSSQPALLERASSLGFVIDQPVELLAARVVLGELRGQSLVCLDLRGDLLRRLPASVMFDMALQTLRGGVPRVRLDGLCQERRTFFVQPPGFAPEGQRHQLCRVVARGSLRRFVNLPFTRLERFLRWGGENQQKRNREQGVTHIPVS